MRVAAAILFVLAFAILAANSLPAEDVCPLCHGSFKITYGDKAGNEKLLEYCSVKDSGKRCSVLIGGWEPCARCAHLEAARAEVKEHEALSASLRVKARMPVQALAKYGISMPAVNIAGTRDCYVYLDADHMALHGLAISGHLLLASLSPSGVVPASDDKVSYCFYLGTDNFKKLVTQLKATGAPHEVLAPQFSTKLAMATVSLPGLVLVLVEENNSLLLADQDLCTAYALVGRAGLSGGHGLTPSALELLAGYTHAMAAKSSVLNSIDWRKSKVEAKGAWDAWADTWDWKPEDELTPVYLRGLALQWLTGLDQHKDNLGEAIKGVLAKVKAGSEPRAAITEAAGMDEAGAAKAFTKWLRGLLREARYPRLRRESRGVL